MCVCVCVWREEEKWSEKTTSKTQKKVKREKEGRPCSQEVDTGMMHRFTITTLYSSDLRRPM